MLPLLTLLWGLNWPVMKIGLQDFTLLSYRSITTAIGAVGLFAIARLAGERIRPQPGDWKPLIWAALLNITGWNTLMLLGVSQMESGRAAILGFTMPVWAAIIGFAFLRTPMTRKQLLGLAAGMAGIALLLQEDLRAMQSAPWGAAAMIAAAICWAGGTVVVRHAAIRTPVISLVAWQQGLGVLPIAAMTLIFDDMDYGAVTLWPLVSLLYNAFIAAILCYWLWFTIVTLVPVAVSSVSTLMVPVVGVFSGMLLLAEQPGPAEFGALALVSAAVALVLIPGRRSAARIRT